VFLTYFFLAVTLAAGFFAAAFFGAAAGLAAFLAGAGFATFAVLAEAAAAFFAFAAAAFPFAIGWSQQTTSDVVHPHASSTLMIKPQALHDNKSPFLNFAMCTSLKFSNLIYNTIRLKFLILIIEIFQSVLCIMVLKIHFLQVVLLLSWRKWEKFSRACPN
jgi:hypothetical protein